MSVFFEKLTIRIRSKPINSCTLLVSVHAEFKPTAVVSNVCLSDYLCGHRFHVGRSRLYENKRLRSHYFSGSTLSRHAKK